MQTVIDFLLGHPYWVHWLLLLCEALATAAVGLGIIWESPKPIIAWESPTYKPDLTRLAHKLVIWGIAFETLFSVSLFVFDEAISHRQQSKIVSLETRIAPRDVTSAPTFELTHAAAWRSLGIMVKSYAFDAEADRLAEQIIKQLNAARFAVADSSMTEAAAKPMAFGIYVSGSDVALVKDLIAWLNQSNLDAVAHDPPPSIMSSGGEHFIVGKETATIFVGSKPLPE